jgi:hypothetical protein
MDLANEPAVAMAGLAPEQSAARTGLDRRQTIAMTAETLIGMIEEMMDLKIQAYAQSNLKLTPELTEILAQKRETDRRRLDQIRVELVRALAT